MISLKEQRDELTRRVMGYTIAMMLTPVFELGKGQYLQVIHRNSISLGEFALVTKPAYNILIGNSAFQPLISLDNGHRFVYFPGASVKGYMDNINFESSVHLVVLEYKDSHSLVEILDREKGVFNFPEDGKILFPIDSREHPEIYEEFSNEFGRLYPYKTRQLLALHK